MIFLNQYRFRVDFHTTTEQSPGTSPMVCSGQFSEVSGLEAIMDPHSISEGGRNWGEIQRAGRTIFSTLILKRGMSTQRDLWTWFQGVASGAYAYRLNARVIMLAADQDTAAASGPLTFEFANCLPIKFRAADLSASSSEIGIEELHLNHEGMTLIPGGTS